MTAATKEKSICTCLYKYTWKCVSGHQEAPRLDIKSSTQKILSPGTRCVDATAPAGDRGKTYMFLPRCLAWWHRKGQISNPRGTHSSLSQTGACFLLDLAPPYPRNTPGPAAPRPEAGPQSLPERPLLKCQTGTAPKILEKAAPKILEAAIHRCHGCHRHHLS